MNSDNIETTAISSVKLALAKADCLDVGYINERDKEPFIDGHIHVKNLHSPGDIRLVNVQVKGQVVNDIDLKSQEIKYSGVPIAHLNNYMHNGGVIYFVVHISEAGNQIYYSCLPPVKIRLLYGDKRDQNTATVSLKPLPSNPNAIAEIMFNFAEHSHRQASFSDNPPLNISDGSTGRITNLQFSYIGIGENPTEVLTHILGQETYTYAEIEGFPCLIPTNDFGTVAQISRIIPGSISADGTEYYSEREVVFSEDIVNIKFGKSLELTQDLTASNMHVSFKITLSGTLNDLLYDLQFVSSLCTQNGFCIEGSFIGLPEVAQQIEESLNLTGKLRLLTDLKKLLGVFGIENEVSVDNIDESEIKNIAWLSDGILEELPRYGLPYSEPMMIVRSHILQYTVLLLAKQHENASYVIEDFGRNDYLCFDGDTNGVKFQTSRYVMLEPEDYGLARNINFDDILDSIVLIEPTEGHCAHSNNMALRMLQAFDSYGRKECLDAARRVFIWLLDVQEALLEKKISTINLIQTNLRSRSLTVEEEATLNEIVTDNQELDPKDRNLTVAALICLGDGKEAQIAFDQLSDDRKTGITEYPIGVLFKSIRSKSGTTNNISVGKDKWQNDSL